MYCTGCDLHKTNSYLATLSHTGEPIKHKRIKKSCIYGLLVANWHWLQDFLVENDVEFVLAHAKYLKAIAYAKVITFIV